MPVAGEPLVRRILRYGAGWGIRDFVLNLHYLPETITAQVGDGADLGVRVRYSFESPVLGSAGRAAKGAGPAAGRDLLHHQRRHAHQRGPARARRASRETGALVTIAVVPNDIPTATAG